MSFVSNEVRSGGCPLGGIVGYPLEQLYEEVAFIAYYFHWPLKDILELEHGDRRTWVEEISGINSRLREEAGGGGGSATEDWVGFSPGDLETFKKFMG
jgi:hypothetical protein